MMKKWIFLFLFVTSLHGNPPTYFEILERIGAQYNVNSTVKEMYASWNAIYQAELSSGSWNNIYGWTNVSYSQQTGYPSGIKSTYYLIPVSWGLKYAIVVNDSLFFYVGFGGDISYLHIRDYISLPNPYTKKWDWGCTAKTGMRYNFAPKGIFEIFADYAYLPFHINSTVVDMSGLQIGASIGVQLGPSSK